MAIDLNNADRQREGGGEIIPDNTVAPVILSLRGLKATKDKSGQMLDIEFTITAGPFSKRKFWGLMMVQGNGSEGHTKAVNITMARVRAIVESAYGIAPTDDGEVAVAARRLGDWDDLDGLEFVARIGIEKGTGEYKDKNVLKSAVTVDDDDYSGFKPAKPKAGASASKPAASGRPAWAR